MDGVHAATVGPRDRGHIGANTYLRRRAYLSSSGGTRPWRWAMVAASTRLVASSFAHLGPSGWRSRPAAPALMRGRLQTVPGATSERLNQPAVDHEVRPSDVAGALAAQH